MNTKHKSSRGARRAPDCSLFKMRSWAHAVRPYVLLICVLCVFAVNSYGATETLKDGWMIRSSAEVKASGEQISTASYKTANWYSTDVPSTVLSALVQNGVYRDPYFGRNLETISVEPFQSAWWYRKEFDPDPSASRATNVRLVFEGINYSANIFVNGSKIASADTTYGAFRHFEVDITGVVRKKANVVAVQLFPPKPGDFTIGFVDWNPTPPDRNMGIWREVKLRTTGAVSLESPFVQTKLDLQSWKQATVAISANLVNHTAQPVSGKIAGEIEGGTTFSQSYSLKAKEEKEIQFEKLTIQNPRVWWPNNMGTPELYSLRLTARDQQGISDKRDVTFGIREVADYLTEQGHRGYIVNGKKVLIRGGGWVDDLFLREDHKKLEAQFQYAKHLNLNLIRLEGIWGSSEKLYELADRYGILLMVGFSCQWEWEGYLGKPVDENYGGILSNADMDLAVQYLHDQVVWLRNHPSILVWAVASDMLPNPELEKRYRAELARIDATRPILAATKLFTSNISGTTGVKMNGPYEYVTPNYWYVDKENGGAFGFDTEVSPGAQPPPAESIQKMFAKEHYWPIDDTWNFHCGRNEFNSMGRYLAAFYKRYGAVEGFEEFAKKSQAMNYEGIRAMYEAFGVRKPLSTGIIQWMLNAAWPKMFWQLYDYYLIGGGAFYGARKGNQPLHIAYDYSNKTIHVVNHTYTSYPSLKAEVKIYSLESKELLSEMVNTSVAENASKRILEIPIKENVVFLSLKLKDQAGKMISDNFYWLSKKEDELDFKATEWFYTPIKEFADFTPLNKLKPATIQVEHKWNESGVAVTLKNPGSQIAFFVELKVTGDKTGRSIVPVFWDDNYVSLLPGEVKQLSARFSKDELRGEKPVLEYSGWNVKAQQQLQVARASLPAGTDWRPGTAALLMNVQKGDMYGKE